jgi:hypothetical protein
MRKLPPRRLNAVGVAVAAAAAEATFEHQLREANLKMPIKNAMRDLAWQMQEHLDAELKKAVERFLGFEVTDPQQIAGRLTHIQPPGDQVTWYQMDGVPVLKAGAQVLERRGEDIHAFQLVEQLLPEDYKPAAAGGIIVPC